MQRAFYEQRGGDAFAEIPHEAVDNPWVAAAYARVIRAFGPATIVELGAGAGRFAFNLRRELGDVRYVMTDFAPSQIAAGRRIRRSRASSSPATTSPRTRLPASTARSW